MNIHDILQKYSASPNVQSILSVLKNGDSPNAKLQIKGLNGSSRAFVFSAVFEQLPERHHCYLMSNVEEAYYLHNDLQALLPKSQVLLLPSPYHRHRIPTRLDKSQVQQRTEILNRFKSKLTKPHVIVTYPEALGELVVDANEITKDTFKVKVGDEFDIDFIIDFLVEYHFERVDFVYEPGTFSIRGGIIDIFSFAAEKPFRIELFGDEIENIKQFDPETQLSEKRLNEVTIIPSMEGNDGRKRIPLLSFLPTDLVIWTDSYEHSFHALNELWDRAQHLSDNIIEELGYHPASLLQNPDDLKKQLKDRTSLEESKKSFFPSEPKLQFKTSPQPAFNKNFDLLGNKLEENDNIGYQTYIFSDAPKQIERIYAILEDMERPHNFVAIYNPLHHGFTDDDLKIACYTEHEIFNRFKNYKAKKSYNQDKALTLKELFQMQPGDFIVHIDHGVGKFSGLEKIDVHHRPQEAVRILYKGGDLLYVNIHSLHKISRYIGQEGKEPTMHKLGGNAWSNLKEKTKNKVKDIARDLIKLYAARKAKKGFAFTPDSYLQTELEASFIYEDTPDQAKTTEEVKKDMEAQSPMDRLVCGDVGFGKTEIAIRAAFKAACDSKQVAVLVPTTVLALQHYKTFKARFGDLPVTVDYVNRFKSTKQIKETLANLKAGKVDIIIGTHRLLSKDIEFKDLGLLIIDEEQKFGVAAKEKLRKFKVNVDTLTLTATPIPRTLSFSLMGARDLSTINTPPPNRQAIDTRLHVFNDDIMAEAINYEVARGGQVFFVHNRIKDIYHYAEKVEQLCPGVKVAVAHGQMEGKQLEEIMVAFVEGFYDVLVSTSIIESGLDISNANTMIVMHAQNFGLSDLYQMRGRVGRSNVKAYCYLFTPPMHSLTDVSRKRLAAIEQHSDLGSGFHIALRDLDIRGAGNILGAEQSGFITEIGVEMYQKILNEAMQELRHDEFAYLFEGEKVPEQPKECYIDTDLELLLPDQYVTNINERMNLYRQLNDVDTETKLEQFRTDLQDRFGRVPEPTMNLLNTMRLKWKAEELGVEKILLKSGKMLANLPNSDNHQFYQGETFGKFLAYVQANPLRVKLKQKDQLVQFTFNKVPNVQAAINCLQEIQDVEMAV
ncbi:MAG: transcription-repair coupling factor [Bacteroidetes bacterium]|nr:transcription-repair coupling factor [Bacteroidota bacterium]